MDAMFETPNVVATLVSAAAAYLLGALWYSPLLFAGAWLRAIGRAKEDLNPRPALFVFAALGWLLAAALYGALAVAFEVDELAPLMLLAVLGWGAFALTPLVTRAIFAGAAPTLLVIDGAYHLAAMAAMAGVRAAAYGLL